MDVNSGNNDDHGSLPGPQPTIATGKAAASGGRGGAVILTMIWTATMVVFLGYMMMWIMFPTATYRDQWRFSVRNKTTSTYFGTSQGANILLYTFPILFMAVAGAISLHLGSRSKKSHAREGSEEKNLLAVWKRPVLTKGPLGIVSGIEFSFFMMFIALLVWCLGVFLNKDFSTPVSPKKLAAYGGHLWRMKLERSGLRLGLVGNVALSFLFFPVTRASSILPLFGLTSEGSIKYHIWLGHIVMTIFTVHGFCYILLWAVNNEISEMLKWAKTDISNVAGELSLLAGLALWVTTYPRIRRKMFELFFYTHYLYILFVFFYVLHVGMSFAFMMLPGFFLFLIDRFLRFLQSRQCVRTISARVLSSQAFELNFSKSQSLKYTPTSTVFINVPGISKLQWHPFTISSSSNLEPERLSVIIKVEGKWTRKLHQLLASSPIDRLEVAVEGPYGPASTNFLRHDTLVMVSGGSGITPFYSIIRELIHARTILNQNIPKLILISAFKTSSDLEMLDLLLPITGTPSDLSRIELQIEAYITQEKIENTSTKQTTRTIWLKPNITDSPITPTLGQNGWLWIALIISASFISFLLLMGVMIRYYIYPIDRNTGEVFSMATESILQMLIMCGCVIVVCTTGVVWNKRKNAMEAKCVVNMESAVTTPTATPGSRFYNTERELESLPIQTVADSTRVHYGERPDLKRILLDYKGSSIGVLVCGPTKMRHDVAAVCASGLADHLHFEAISFSW